MLRRLLPAVALALALLAPSARAQLPPSEAIVINQTPVQGGSAAQCLYITSGRKVGSQACSTGSVTTFSAGTTGFTPSSATSGAVTLAGVLNAANGGTGVANTGTLTLGGNLVTSGAFPSTFTMTGATTVTFPTSGTLATTATPAASIVVGTTTITGGTPTRILYDNAGVLGEYTLTGSGTVAVMQTSPSLITPALGVATATSLAIGGATIGSNGLAVTGTTTVSGAALFSTSVIVGAATTSGALWKASGGTMFARLGDDSDVSSIAAGGISSNASYRGTGTNNFLYMSNVTSQAILSSGNNGTGLGFGFDFSVDSTFKCRNRAFNADCSFTAGNATFSGATVIMSALATDATHTDNSVCVDSTTGLLYKGSGTIGICLGTSSARYKRDVADIDGGLDQVMALLPKRYRYLPGYGDDGAREQVGFLAEDMAITLPALVALDAAGRPNSVDIVGLIPLLVRAVQQQQAEIQALRRGR